MFFTLRHAKSLTHKFVLACLFTVALASLNVSDSLAASASPPPQPPNFLIIIADDMGFSDIGPFGSEIATPTLDQLAQSGVRLANFHVHTNCSPSRAMLFSGLDNHKSGVGTMQGYQTQNQKGVDGYSGYLLKSATTFARRLKEYDYQTYMVGKWHLGLADDLLPSQRGFDQTYILAEGSADFFDPLQGVLSILPVPNYRQNGKAITPPAENFYATTFYTDKLIEMFEATRKENMPFLAVASYTAPHWPIQAPEELVTRYNGVYDRGYDDIAKKRLERQKNMGLIPKDVKLPARPEAWRGWDELTEEQKARETRSMQVYAAMVDALDTQIGRLISHLKKTEDYDNTVIIFLSDNGPEGNNPIDLRDNRSWVPKHFNLSTENIGRPNSYSYSGPGWAGVSATPFKLYKAFPTQGGTRVPSIVSYPKHFKKGEISSAFTSVLDIAPTILELALPPIATTTVLQHLDGTSMASHLRGDQGTVHEPDSYMGWELWDRKAIQHGSWRAVAINQPWGDGEDTWQLYNHEADLGEQVNLADKHPEKMAKMIALWEEYKKANSVIKPENFDLTFSNTTDYYETENQ